LNLGTTETNAVPTCSYCGERNFSRQPRLPREQLNIWSIFNADPSVVDGRSGRTHCRFYAAAVTVESKGPCRTSRVIEKATGIN
jgi:hypothetical protein